MSDNKVIRLMRIVSKVKGEKGAGIGALLKGRFDHNHSLVLGTREQNEEGEWVTDKATEIHFASGKVLDLTAKDHFLNAYMADEFGVYRREDNDDAPEDDDGF